MHSGALWRVEQVQQSVGGIVRWEKECVRPTALCILLATRSFFPRKLTCRCFVLLISYCLRHVQTGQFLCCVGAEPVEVLSELTPAAAAQHATALAAKLGVSGGNGGQLTRKGSSGAIEEENKRFLRAAASGDLSLVRGIGNGMPSLEVLDAEGRTALHAAATNGHVEVVEYLLANGLNPDVPDKWGVTALSEKA